MDPAILSACRETLKAQDDQFYLASLMAPGDSQLEVTSLYAFHCELARIPALVSEPMLGEIRLTWWKEALEELIQGKARPHPVVEALCAVAKGTSLDIEALTSMVEARIPVVYGDLGGSKQQIESFAAQTGGALLKQVAYSSRRVEADSERLESVGTCWTSLRVAEAGLAVANGEIGDEGLRKTLARGFEGGVTDEMKGQFKQMAQTSRARLIESLNALSSRRARQLAMPAALEVLNDGGDENSAASTNRTRAIAKAWWYGVVGRI